MFSSIKIIHEKNVLIDSIIKIRKTIGMIARLTELLRSLYCSYKYLQLFHFTIRNLSTDCLWQWVQCFFKQNHCSSRASAALTLFNRSKRTCHSFICKRKKSSLLSYIMKPRANKCLTRTTRVPQSTLLNYFLKHHTFIPRILDHPSRNSLV